MCHGSVVERIFSLFVKSGEEQVRSERRVLSHDSNLNKVLMVSWAFPPAGGSGVQRSAKFAKYLPAWGWEPIVWTTDRIVDLPYDESLLSDLPAELDIRRGHNPDPFNYLRRVLSFGEKRGKQADRWDWRSGYNWRLARLLAKMREIMIPDPGILWVLGSFLKCRRIIEREGIDVIYSTYSPPCNHLLGWMLKKATGKPWVADFRDLWTQDYCYPYNGSFRKKIDWRFEKLFLENADVVISVTDGQAAKFRESIAGDKEKVITITNGVDMADFDVLDRSRLRSQLHGSEGKFLLTFVGWFLQNRLGNGLLEGLGRFAEWVKTQDGEYEFRIVGTLSRDMTRILSRHGIEVTSTGYVPHAEAIKHLVAADVLLLPASPGIIGDTCIGGKTYEYLASGRPILLDAPSETGETFRLLRECDSGECVVSTPENVFGALQRLWRRWRVGDLPPGCSAEKIEPMTRENLAGRLASILDKQINKQAATARASADYALV